MTGKVHNKTIDSSTVDTPPVEQPVSQPMPPAPQHRPIGHHIVDRIFNGGAASLDYAHRFHQWAGIFFLFTALSGFTVYTALLSAAPALITLTFLPLLVYVIIFAFQWARLYRRPVQDAGVARYRKSTYRFSYGLAAYIGLASGWLLNTAGIDYLPHLALWTLGMGLAIGALSGLNALQYGLRLMLAILPITLMLISTGNTRYTGLAFLVYLIVFIATLIKLNTSEFLQKLYRKHQTLTIEKTDTQDRLHDFLQYSNDWLWESTHDHTLSYISDNFERITGQKTQHHLNSFRLNEPSHYKYALTNDAIDTLIAALQDHQPINPMEYKLRTKDGQTRWYSLHATPRFTSDGAFLGYRGWAQDVTQIIRTREKLQTYDATLEKKVTFRTTSLEAVNAEHRQAAETATRANLAKTGFLQKTSQDFRAPIQKITRLAGNLNTHADTSVKTCAEEITQASHHLLRLANNMLYLAHLDDNKFQEDESTFSIDDLVREAVYDITLESTRKDISITTPRLGGIDIIGNYNGLKKALFEVLHNAVKYSTEKSEIRVTIDKKSAPNPGIYITVSDNAPPIRESIIKKIHSLTMPPQHRGRPTAKSYSRSQDSATGLTISTRLMRAHNGSLQITPAQPSLHGNKVSLILPRSRLASHG